MQNQEVKGGFEISAEEMKAAGFENSVLIVKVRRGKITIRKATKHEFKRRQCDGECDTCPWSRMC